MKRYLLIFTIFVLNLTSLTAVANATEVAVTLTSPAPAIEEVDGYHRVTLQETRKINDAGSPNLPSYGVWMLLPPGEHAMSVELRDEKWESIPGKFIIEPTPTPHPLSLPNPPETVPDPNIYEGKEVYPLSAALSLNTHLKRGYALATCLVFPVRWNPADGSIEYLASAELVIQTDQGEREQESFNRFFKGDRTTEQWVANQVLNPEDLGQYPRRDVGEVESMLIVTVADFENLAEEYAEWHNVRGLVTNVVTCAQYIDEEDGDDAQECIRNGIISAWAEEEFDYVLLVGDVEQVPHRGLYATVNNSPDIDIPADLYYATFDGNWNNDGDDRWGEGNEADLLAEVYVGRICGGTEAEVARTMDKVRLYSDEPVVDDVLDILMVGEDLGWQSMGGDYMDEVYEECDRYGYETCGYPDRFERRNLYDRDEVWNAVNDLAPLMSAGYHHVNHLGHANTTYVMKFRNGDLNDEVIGNDGVENGFNIVWTQGCYAGSFDNRTTNPEQYVGDCITEKFMHQLDNGTVAFMSNSRYGWGSGGNTNGASQHFHREYIDAIYDEDFTRIGAANQDSKEDVTPWMDSGVMRWCYWEINLFGDPSMDIWTDEPEEIEAHYDQAIVIGDESFEVRVEQAPASVTLSRNGEMMYAAATDEQGVATFDIPEPIVPPGDVTLTIIAHDCLPFEDEIQSIPSNTGFPWVEELLLLDIDGGGVEDGMASPGETIELSPSVRNLGREVLEGLTATVTIDDPHITILQGQVEFDPIDPDEQFFSIDDIRLEIGTTIGDLHRVDMDLEFEDEDGNSWSQTLSFVAHAPVINENQLIILDQDGNNNGRLDPGEEVEAILTLTNNGTGPATNVAIGFFSGSPMVEINDGGAEIEMFRPNSTVEVDQIFRFTVSEDMPDPYRAVLYLRLTGDRGMQRSHLIDLSVGGVFNDFDRDQEMWEHDVFEGNEDYVDQWHMSDEDNYSPDGVGCLKFGGENGEDYADMSNGVINLPDVFVSVPMEMMFWHKIDAEDSRAHPDTCYDGGFVEINVDDTFWRTLYPVTPEGRGYPYVILHGQAENPLDEGQACFSGDHDWKLAMFDLSAYEGYGVQIRLRFGSDAEVTRGGWWIDDIELKTKIGLEYPDNLEGEITEYGIQLDWDTPEVPRRDDGVVPNELLGYRIYRGINNEEWAMLDVLVADNTYFDDLIGMPHGEYMYMVTAEYLIGESDPSNLLFLEWANTVEDDAQAIPEEWAITSTFPNPFNNVTTIGYSVPAVGDVSLGVYDLQGRLVQQLHNGMVQPGHYRVGFNGKSLPSGLYLVRMQTPEGNHMKRLLLLK